MEIDCTKFVTTEDMFDFAHSEAEHGGVPGTAGRDTYNAALAAAERYPLVTDANRVEFDEWCADFGAWEREEIAAWTNTEATALLLQFIAGDVREYESDSYDEESHGGRFYCTLEREAALEIIDGKRGIDGVHFYFYMGS